MKKIIIGLVVLGSISVFAGDSNGPVTATIKIEANSKEQCERLHKMVFDESREYAYGVNIIIAENGALTSGICDQLKVGLDRKFLSKIKLHLDQ